MSSELLQASIFYKFAAFNFGPEMDWVPEDFKKLPPFQEHSGFPVIKNFAQYGLNDFKEKIEIDPAHNIEIAGDLLYTIYYNLQEFALDAYKNDDFFNKQLVDFTKIIKKMLENLSTDELKLTEKITLDKTTFPAGSKILRIYEFLKKIAIQKYNFQLPALEQDPSFKDYSKRPKNFWIVFSTKPNDLIGIADRSIESCQSLFNQGEYNPTESNQCLIGTVLSKYVGVIYVTSGSDFESRGEKMLYRCLVRIIYDKKYKQNMIYLDQMYPSHNTDYLVLFREALEKKSTIPVTWYEEYSDTVKEIESPEDEETIPAEYQSYKDFNTLKKLERLALTPYDELKRIEAIKLLPQNSPVLLKLLKDESEDIRNAAARRIDTKLLGDYLNKSSLSEDIREELEYIYKDKEFFNENRLY